MYIPGFVPLIIWLALGAIDFSKKNITKFDYFVPWFLIIIICIANIIHPIAF